MTVWNGFIKSLSWSKESGNSRQTFTRGSGHKENYYFLYLITAKEEETPSKTDLGRQNIQVRIVEDDATVPGVGELHVKSPSMFKEYWQKPEVWFETSF